MDVRQIYGKSQLPPQLPRACVCHARFTLLGVGLPPENTDTGEHVAQKRVETVTRRTQTIICISYAPFLVYVYVVLVHACPL